MVTALDDDYDDKLLGDMETMKYNLSYLVKDSAGYNVWKDIIILVDFENIISRISLTLLPDTLNS